MRRRWSRCAIAAFAASLVLSARIAAAGELLVRMPACERPVFDYQELVEGLKVELEPDGLTPRISSDPANAESGDAELHIDVPCLMDAQYVVLRVRMADGRHASRRMELADLSTRTRPLGISVVAAEVLRSATTSDAEEKAPTTSSTLASTREESIPPPSTRPSSFRLHAAGEARLFVSEATPLFGVTLGAHIDRIHGALHLLRGGANDRLGDFTITLPHASIGFDAWRWEGSDVALSVGPRLGAGAVIANAQAELTAFGRETIQPYIDAVIDGEGRIQIDRSVWLMAGLDVGYARGLVVLADNRVVACPDGIFGALRVGLAFAPRAGVGANRSQW